MFVGPTPIAVALLVLGVLAAAALLYALWARWLVRRYRLPEPVGEQLSVELETLGHFISLIHLTPPRRQYREPVILCHGLAANRFNLDFHPPGSDRLSLARALQRRGFDVWLLETRGHGMAQVPRRAVWTVHDEVEQDVPTAIQTVLDVTGAERVFWIGHSWGGLLQLLYQAGGGALRDRVAGMVTLGSPARFDLQRWHHPLFRPLIGLYRAAPRLGWPLGRLARAGLPLAPWTTRLLGRYIPQVVKLDTSSILYLLASIPEDIPAGKIRLLLEWGRTGRPRLRDGSEVPWDRIGCPTYVIGGNQDWISPPEATRFLRDQLTGCADLSYRIFGSEEDPFGHTGLLLGDGAPRSVFPSIADWLAARAQPQAIEEIPRGEDRVS